MTVSIRLQRVGHRDQSAKQPTYITGGSRFGLNPADRLPLEAVMESMTADVPVRYQRLKRGISPLGMGWKMRLPLFVPHVIFKN